MKEPKRLASSPEFEFRDELHAVLGVEADYNLEAGLARFQASLAAPGLGDALPVQDAGELPEALSLRASEATVSSVTPGASSLLGRFALFGAGVVGLSGIALGLSSAPLPRDEAPRSTVTLSTKEGVREATQVQQADSATPPVPPTTSDEARPTELGALPSVEVARQRREGVRAKAPVAASSEVSLTDSELSREMRELREMRRFLATSPETALALASRTQFPSGAFRPERSVVVIEAYVRLGRASEAKAAARVFLAHEPNHPESERVRRLTGLTDTSEAK